VDERDFDNLARWVAAGTGSRRGVLRLLTGGALGGGLTRLGLQEAAGACKAVGKRCERGRDCCSKRCSKRGRCRCAPPASACQSSADCCQTDPFCCDGVCRSALGGACTTVADCCPGSGSGVDCCDNVCTATGTDENNCGACGQPCPVGQACNADGCCIRRGDACTLVTASQCCGNLDCSATIPIQFGVCCIASGGSCSLGQDGACCSGQCNGATGSSPGQCA
jgi:hypothetical protein